VQSTEITSFEREKLLLSKNMIEKGENFPSVLRRLSLTLIERSLQGGLSKETDELFKKLSTQISRVQIFGLATVGVVMPL